MANADNHIPHEDGRWKFDDSVAENFDAMLQSSIPMYQEMRRLCHELGRHFVAPNSTIVDLGASRGEALRPFIEDNEAYKYIAVEVSKPMREAMRELYGNNPKVWIDNSDLRDMDWDELGECNISLILSILTIQFTPIEYRLHILQNIYDAMLPGGAFLFVEKVMGGSATLDKIMVEEYYGMKSRNGYSYEDIKRKRAALEGVLVPMTAAWNEDMLRTVGFKQVDCFYRNLNFAGWIAIK